MTYIGEEYEVRMANGPSFSCIDILEAEVYFYNAVNRGSQSQDICTNIGVRLGKGVGSDGGYINSIEAV